MADDAGDLIELGLEGFDKVTDKYYDIFHDKVSHGLPRRQSSKHKQKPSNRGQRSHSAPGSKKDHDDKPTRRDSSRRRRDSSHERPRQMNREELNAPPQGDYYDQFEQRDDEAMSNDGPGSYGPNDSAGWGATQIQERAPYEPDYGYRNPNPVPNPNAALPDQQNSDPNDPNADSKSNPAGNPQNDAKSQHGDDYRMPKQQRNGGGYAPYAVGAAAGLSGGAFAARYRDTTGQGDDSDDDKKGNRRPPSPRYDRDWRGSRSNLPPRRYPSPSYDRPRPRAIPPGPAPAAVSSRALADNRVRDYRDRDVRDRDYREYDIDRRRYSVNDGARDYRDSDRPRNRDDRDSRALEPRKSVDASNKPRRSRSADAKRSDSKGDKKKDVMKEKDEKHRHSLMPTFAGAVAGGLVGRKYDKQSPLVAALGAVIGAVGADAMYVTSKKKQEEREREWAAKAEERKRKERKDRERERPQQNGF